MPNVTFTYTAGEIARMNAALGREQSLGRDATNAETKAFWITQQKIFVLDSERKAAKKAAEAGITDTAFDPT